MDGLLDERKPVPAVPLQDGPPRCIVRYRHVSFYLVVQVIGGVGLLASERTIADLLRGLVVNALNDVQSTSKNQNLGLVVFHCVDLLS